MSSRPSLSLSKSATPPLIDSTMYLFSGEATWRKVMPACAVMSVKRTSTGAAGAEIRGRSCATKSATSRANFFGKTATSRNPVCEALRSCLSALLLFQLLVEFELAIAVGLAARGLVGARELEVDVGLVGRKARRGFEVLRRLTDVALLEQGLAEFVARLGEVGPGGDDLAKGAETALGLLARELDEAEMVLGLEVCGIQCQLGLELARGVVEAPGLEVDEAGVVVREQCFGVERERGLEFVERVGRVALLVVCLSEDDVELGAVAIARDHLLDDLIGFGLFALLDEREGERVVEADVVGLERDHFRQQRGRFGVVLGHEVAHAEQLLGLRVRGAGRQNSFERRDGVFVHLGLVGGEAEVEVNAFEARVPAPRRR